MVGKPRRDVRAMTATSETGMSVRRLARWIGFALLSICVLLISSWCALAIWFRCGLDEPARSLLAGAPLLLAIVTVVCLATSWRWRVLTANVAAVAVIIVLVGEHRAIERPGLGGGHRPHRHRNHRWRPARRQQCAQFRLAQRWRTSTSVGSSGHMIFRV